MAKISKIWDTETTGDNYSPNAGTNPATQNSFCGPQISTLNQDIFLFFQTENNL